MLKPLLGGVADVAQFLTGREGTKLNPFSFSRLKKRVQKSGSSAKLLKADVCLVMTSVKFTSWISSWV